MNTMRPSPREIGERGKAIYESRIRTLVEREHFGKYLVIDIETGEYEIDEDLLSASHGAAAKRPEGLRYGMKIGYKAIGRM